MVIIKGLSNLLTNSLYFVSPHVTDNGEAVPVLMKTELAELGYTPEQIGDMADGLNIVSWANGWMSKEHHVIR